LLNGPREPTPDNLRYPVVGQLEMSPLVGAHTTLPLGNMPLRISPRTRPAASATW